MDYLKRDDTKYIINSRWTVGLRKKYFVVFSVGHDLRRREIGTNIDRRKNTPLGQAIVYSGIFAWIIVCVVLVSIIALYILKSRLGIDIVEDGHPIPEFLQSIGLCH